MRGTFLPSRHRVTAWADVNEHLDAAEKERFLLAWAGRWAFALSEMRNAWGRREGDGSIFVGEGLNQRRRDRQHELHFFFCLFCLSAI